MKRREFIQGTVVAAVTTVLTPTGFLYSHKKKESTTPLEQAFRAPPASARPFTWWHWINGNVTREGITRDLEAMAEVGIGGFQAFSVDSGIPSGPADYLSPLWLELMDHAAREADRLGLEFDLHNCMGWSSSGGSWITPALSMQQIVWTEAFVEGGKAIRIKLKEPFKRLGYYRDAFVVAFPTVSGKNAPEQVPPRVTLNGNPVDAEAISGFGISSGIEVSSPRPTQPSYLTFAFDRSVLVRSLVINTSHLEHPTTSENTIIVEASDDGREYRKIAEVPALSNEEEIPVATALPSTQAPYFRLVIPLSLNVANVRWSASAGIPGWPGKANFPNSGYYPEVALAPSWEAKEVSDRAIAPDSVVDITQYLDEQGVLHWEAPDGHWTIVRLGHTTTGSTNRPAEGKGVGLECDKYNPEAFDFHFSYIMDQLWPSLQKLAKKGNLGMLVDSYEVNLQNWTQNFPQEFEQRRGYAIYRFLPVLTGRVVGSINTSERFLWDFRKTCADMMADHYQGKFVALCKEHNIISYTEPYNRSPFQQMEAGAEVDINMGEFWLKAPHFTPSIKVASSIQNMNGRQIVGAESFTGRPQYAKWQAYPFSMKAQGDFMFTQGLNRFIFHRYAHQPHPTAAPGMTMGPWGFHFDRTNTWFFQGKPWLAYISRCQYMLQQGVFVGDVLCFTGEEAPGDDISMGALRPDLPAGYDFQFIDTNILLHRVTIHEGDIVLPDGLRFRMLILPDKPFMTVAVARKLKELVSQGMILLGPRPGTIPTLTDYENAISEFDQRVEELWGPAEKSLPENKVGQGRVFAHRDIPTVLEALGIPPDFEYTSKSGDAPIHYIHRKLEEGHLYFVANRRRFEEDLVCTFRVSGYEPELWDADTGEAIPIKLYDVSDDRTSLPLHLGPAGSVLVVFRSPASPQRLLSIAHQGKTLVSAQNIAVNQQPYNPPIANDFTVSLWVKPETDEQLPKGLGAYEETTRYTACYPVYPPPGKDLFGEGHASFCLLVARNGVVVFEKEDENLLAGLLAPMPIASWTHFTVVYRGGIPTLYVNGEFVKAGEKSGKVVHPVVGQLVENKKLFYYDGDLSAPEVVDAPLSGAQIKALYTAGRPTSAHSVKVEPAKGTTAALLYWQNGEFTLKEAPGKDRRVLIRGLHEPRELNGPWTVTFPPGLGAPERITLSRLRSLHTHPADGVKYFSGTATYSQQFNASPALLADQKRVFLELGRVAVVAEIVLNGRTLGIVWKPPYRIDITETLKPGSNDLRVNVTTLWPNRLIGDEQLPVENEYQEQGPNGASIVALPAWYRKGQPKPAGGRITFSTWRHFNQGDPLLESGLIGPVIIRHASVKEIEAH